MDWAAWFERDYANLCGWLRTFAVESDVEDIVADSLEIALTKGDIRHPEAFMRGVAKHVWKERCRSAAVAHRNQRDVVESLVQGERLLVSVKRCQRRAQKECLPFGYGKGHRLPTLECPVCTAPYQPRFRRSNTKDGRTTKRKETCGAPRCAKTLYWRKRKAAA